MSIASFASRFSLPLLAVVAVTVIVSYCLCYGSFLFCSLSLHSIPDFFDTFSFLFFVPFFLLAFSSFRALCPLTLVARRFRAAEEQAVPLGSSLLCQDRQVAGSASVAPALGGGEQPFRTHCPLAPAIPAHFASVFCVSWLWRGCVSSPAYLVSLYF